MHVAIDISSQLSGIGGVARYLNELAGALERAGVAVARIAFGRGGQKAPAGTRRLRVPSRFAYPLARSLRLPLADWLAPAAQVVHGGPPALPGTRKPLVATVYDLDALIHPDLHSERSVKAEATVLLELSKADAVITISRYMAGVLEGQGIPRERIVPIPLGVARFPPPVQPNLHEPYILAVGQLMPRKGFDLLLAAYARSQIGSYRLVIAGPENIQAPQLRSLANDLGLGRRVTFAGPVSDAELAGLYRSAALVCVPSVAEGFGLPIIEAMAAGAPVLASSIDVFKEVSGGHARLVPSRRTEAWANALRSLLDKPNERKRMAKQGQRWAEQFTWDRTAAETREVYESVLSRRHPR